MWLSQAIREALFRSSDPAAVDPLIAALEDNNKWVRKAAARALYYLDEARAVRPLVTMLGDPYQPARYWAAVALGELGDSGAEDPLAAALGDQSLAVREAAAEALGKLKSPRTAPSLLAVLSDEDWDVREAAIEALGELGDSSYIAAIVGALCGAPVFVRMQAAEALGKIGGEEAFEPLCGALEDDNIWVRREAALALVRVGGERAAGPLKQALFDRDENVRRAVRQALKAIDCEVPRFLRSDSTVLPRVNPEDQVEIALQIAHLYDASPECRVNAAKKLIDIGKPATGNLAILLDEDDPRLRALAINVLRRIGSPAVPVLCEVLQDGEWQAREAALWALGLIATPRARAAISRAYSDKHPDVRRTAREALCRCSRTQSLQAPKSSESTEVTDPPYSIGAMVKELHRRPRFSGGALPLLPLLKGEDAALRAWAAWALGRMGRAAVEAIPHLTEALEDPEDSVRQAAAQALEEIKGDSKRAGVATLDTSSLAMEEQAWLLRISAALASGGIFVIGVGLHLSSYFPIEQVKTSNLVVLCLMALSCFVAMCVSLLRLSPQCRQERDQHRQHHLAQARCAVAAFQTRVLGEVPPLVKLFVIVGTFIGGACLVWAGRLQAHDIHIDSPMTIAWTVRGLTLLAASLALVPFVYFLHVRPKLRKERDAG
jgi:HEAT repeat protein